jgi:hypothetical protein
MKLELPKVTLESSDISRLHDLLGMAWRADGSSTSPDGQTSRAERDSPIYKQYQTLAAEVLKAAEAIAQDAFAAGVQYSRQNA